MCLLEAVNDSPYVRTEAEAGNKGKSGKQRQKRESSYARKLPVVNIYDYGSF